MSAYRALERECQRNLELIWLTGRLAPDFKTIADFRRDNGPAIRRVCTQFVTLCRCTFSTPAPSRSTAVSSLTSNARAEGRYDRRDFVYDAKTDTYICPANERLTYRMTTEEGGKVLRRYWTSGCEACALKKHCTPILERVQQRLDRRPDARAPLNGRASIRDD